MPQHVQILKHSEVFALVSTPNFHQTVSGVVAGTGDFTLVWNNANLPATVPAIYNKNKSLLQIYDIAPTNPGLCPWGSQLAQHYQEYEPLGVAVTFESTSAPVIYNQGNSAIGEVVMGCLYNPNQMAPRSQIEMKNLEHYVSMKPNESKTLFFECSSKDRPLRKFFTGQQLSSTSTTSDPRFMILARLFFAVCGYPQGTPNGGTILPVASQGWGVPLGNMRIDYHYKLSKPCYSMQDIYYNWDLPIATVANTLPFGTAETWTLKALASEVSIGNPRVYLQSITNFGIITFDNQLTGSFLVTLNVRGTAAALRMYDLAIAGGVSFNPIFGPLVTDYYRTSATVGAGTCTDYIYQVAIFISARGDATLPSLTFVNTGGVTNVYPTAITSATLTIESIDD
jgi:hypothetical protein